MSVQDLPFELYEEVFNKTCTYISRCTLDIDYCSTLQLTELQARTWVSYLNEMVYLSYCSRYRHKPEGARFAIDAVKFGRLRYANIKHPPCSTYQMLKHLHCIDYQIECTTMREAGLWEEEYEQPYTLLQEAITEIGLHIIQNHPEYQAAQYGNSSLLLTNHKS